TLARMKSIRGAIPLGWVPSTSTSNDVLVCPSIVVSPVPTSPLWTEPIGYTRGGVVQDPAAGAGVAWIANDPIRATKTTVARVPFRWSLVRARWDRRVSGLLDNGTSSPARC